MLDAPDFDRATALRAHRERLAADARRYRRLVRTIDETLAALEGATMMDDKAMYRGFDPEKQAGYEAWVVDRYGPGIQKSIDASKRIISKWTQAEFDASRPRSWPSKRASRSLSTSGAPADSERRTGGDPADARLDSPLVDQPYQGGVHEARRALSRAPGLPRPRRGRAAGLTEYLVEAMGSFAERELT